jgi:hypothetical protein
LSRKLHADERGISPVLGATLLLATIITVVSIFLAVWVPGELSRRERDYILGTEDAFRELKGTIETLNPGDNGSVNLSMSPGSLPLIPNPKVAGTLSIIPAENASDLGRLKFDWDGWSLVYESGVIIFIQENTILMKSPPSVLTVRQVDNNNFEVHFNVFRVSGFKESTSGTGTSNIEIYVENQSSPPPTDNDNVAVKINSSYMSIWMQYLANEVNELKGMGIRATLDNVNGILKIIGDNKKIHYYQNVTNIEIDLK